MLALYIILGILFLIFILLIIPLTVSFTYINNVECSFRYLFLNFKILPKEVKEDSESKNNSKPSTKKKKKKKAAESSEKESEGISSKIKKLIKGTGVKGFLEILAELLKLIGIESYKLIRHLHLWKPDIYLCVSADNAADTALNYGKMCSAVYPAVSLIYDFFHCKNGKITIDLNYNEAESKVKATAKIYILPVFVVIIALRLVRKGLPLVIKLIRPKRNTISQAKKG